MSPWTILGWLVLAGIALRALGIGMVALGRRLERRTPEGRAAQACRDLADALGRKHR